MSHLIRSPLLCQRSICAILATLCALVSAYASAHDFGASITWNREISRIVFDKCASCHRPGGTAFSLLTYEDAQPHAADIEASVLARHMPPWGAVKGFGDFANDLSLSQAEIEFFTDWVEGGARRGNNRKLLPVQPTFDAKVDSSKTYVRITLRGTAALERNIEIVALEPKDIDPHASRQIVAVSPDGTITPLVWLYEYDERHSHLFELRAPLMLHAGTVIRGLHASERLDLLTR